MRNSYFFFFLSRYLFIWDHPFPWVRLLGLRSGSLKIDTEPQNNKTGKDGSSGKWGSMVMGEKNPWLWGIRFLFSVFTSLYGFCVRLLCKNHGSSTTVLNDRVLTCKIVKNFVKHKYRELKKEFKRNLSITIWINIIFLITLPVKQSKHPKQKSDSFPL